MKCANVKKELELMFEAVKPGAEALAHISACGKCRAEYEAMVKITRSLKGMEEVKCPPNFNKMVWDRIGEPAPSLFGNIFRPALVFGGAAAAALVVFMVFFAKPAAVNKQDSFAVKPVIVKEKIVKKPVIKEEPQIAPQEKPVIAQKVNEAPAVQDETGGVSPGKMPVLVKSSGADSEYLIKQEESNKISAASVSKRPGVLESPLLVKNNVIKPLEGRAMTIAYKVEPSCNVLIRVYNRKGEPVRTLVQAFMAAGDYEETWLGQDDKGVVVGDGVYIVHVKTCLTEQKIKAIVVK